MRLVYTADLHGDIRSFRALLDLAVKTEACIVIVGGDLLPHANRIQSAIEKQRDFIARALRPLLEVFHAQHPDIVVYLLAGNDDWAAAITGLDALASAGLAHPLHERVYDLCACSNGADLEAKGVCKGDVQQGGVRWLAGYSCVPPTPFSIKDYERRDVAQLPPFSFDMAYVSWSGVIEPVQDSAIAVLPSIADDLEALVRQSDPARTVYICHTPPFDTPLDQMANGRPVGSRALRTFIERYA